MDRSTTKHGPTQVATMINHFYNFYSNSQKDRQVNYSELSLFLWDLILLSYPFGGCCSQDLVAMSHLSQG
jgi:hypothetical protein